MQSSPLIHHGLRVRPQFWNQLSHDIPILFQLNIAPQRGRHRPDTDVEKIFVRGAALPQIALLLHPLGQLFTTGIKSFANHTLLLPQCPQACFMLLQIVPIDLPLLFPLLFLRDACRNSHHGPPTDARNRHTNTGNQEYGIVGKGKDKQ